MPFTPLHMGPALALKIVSARYFSVLMFGIAQVAMDIEPLVGILRDDDVLHGWTHTYVGATVIGLLVWLSAAPFCRWLLAVWNRELMRRRLAAWTSPADIGWRAAAIGSFVGTYSHVVLDSIMHADMQPLAPVSPSNAMLRAIPLDTLHLVCFASGAIGVAVWWLRGWRRRFGTD